MSNFRLRLWRRFRVAPGVTLNLSNRGVSTSFGIKGAHLTVGRRGMRQTIGAPGTGIYLTKFEPYQPSSRISPPRGASQRLATPHSATQRNATSFNPIVVAAGGFARGILWVVLAVGVIAVITSLVGR